MRNTFRSRFRWIFMLAIAALMVVPFAAFASDVAVAVVDVTVPNNSVSLAPGASAPITINMTVTGKQDGTATFEVNRNWTLSGGTFTGSNPVEFTVAPRAATDPATTFSTSGTVTAAAGQAAGAFTLAVSTFDITNSNTTGAKLVDGADGSYQVIVAATKTASTVTVICPESVGYNGSAQTPCSATAMGAGGLNESLTVAYTNNTNAGTATASASFAGDATHTGNTGSASFEIVPAPVTATAGGGSATYDGTTHAPSACAVTGAYKGDLTCANDPTSVGPDAGTTEIAPVLSGTGLGNFNITSLKGSFTINKANATCTVTGYSVIFDNAAHTASGSCTGVLGESLSGLNLTGTTHTNVGTYIDGWSFAGNGNYNPDSGTVNDAILAWTLNGFYQPVDMNGVYNTIKGGSTVPLKFEVFAGSTELTALSTVKSFTQAKITCDSTALTDDVEVTTTGGTSLRYDATAGQFVQNWQTPKSAGTCYRVTMTTQDGSSLTAFFKLK